MFRSEHLGVELHREGAEVDPAEVSRVLKARQDVQDAELEILLGILKERRGVTTAVHKAGEWQLGEGLEGFHGRIALAKRFRRLKEA